jgi:hypothetical protein
LRQKSQMYGPIASAWNVRVQVFEASVTDFVMRW